MVKYSINYYFSGAKRATDAKPIKTRNYIIFEDEAVISGARNYLKGRNVEIEILYRIGDNYERGWFRVEKLE